MNSVLFLDVFFALPCHPEDDEEFCLVKRLLGKGGCNMSAIANSFDAKIRLRGRGSWHLETLQQEADMPLQIHVSCREFGNPRRMSQLCLFRKAIPFRLVF